MRIAEAWRILDNEPALPNTPVDLTGQTFGRWTALYPIGKIGPQWFWLCRCLCGSEGVVAGYVLKIGRSKSCGCLLPEWNRKTKTKHGHAPGHTGSPEYRSWMGAKDRCFNKNNPAYKYYGGRGITMSDEWANDFNAVFRHMGPKPTPQHTLDRIDNNGPYTGPCAEYPKGNCRWATQKEQQNNRRQRRWYEYTDYAGERFGRLVALKRVYRSKAIEWQCQCDCGRTCIVQIGQLRTGATVSCGCLRREMAKFPNHLKAGVVRQLVAEANRKRKRLQRALPL